MRTKINNILEKFSHISLDDMANVKLMDRTDTKFTFHISQLPIILEEMKKHYSCLSVNEKKISHYQTLYYDTNEMMLYTKHHNGELNRYKIRHRTYVDSNAGYLEVKFKNNKGRTIKERIKERSPSEKFGDSAYNFLAGELPFSPALLKPVIWVNYGRITLVSKTAAERVTIDVGLEFKKDDKQLKLDELVIVEVKQEKRKPSHFLACLRSHHIREGSISKYCFAIASTRRDVKKNNFKEKLLSLKHIIDYDFIAGSGRNAG